MALRNGLLLPSQLASIYGGKLHKVVAPKWNRMAVAAAKDGVQLIPSGPDSSYRTLARQWHWRRFWCNLGKCFMAAVPGTSNHGLGRAVDVRNANGPNTPGTNNRVWNWLVKHGPEFGFTNTEGAGVGEDWHWGYVGPWVMERDPLAELGPRRRRAAGKLLRYRRAALIEGATGHGPAWERLVAMRDHMHEVVERYERRAEPGKQKNILKRVLEDRDGNI